MQNKILMGFDFFKHITTSSYIFTKKVLTHFITSITPSIQRLFAKNTQDVLDLQTATQEQTTRAHYDFKDVIVEETFDEMRPDSPSQTESAHTESTNMATQPSLDTLEPIISPTPQTSQLQIVEASEDTNLEDFFKNQVAKHFDMLQNLKLYQHTALSEPALKYSESKPTIPTQESTLPQESTPSQTDTLFQTSHTKEISTPPPRPINPNVFLQTAPKQESITPIHIKNENIRAATQESTQSKQDSHTNTTLFDYAEYDDNLQTQMPQFTPFSLLTPMQSEVQPSIPTKQNTIPQHTQNSIQPNTQDTASHTMAQTLNINIQEIPTSNIDWVDSIVQEIPQEQKPKPQPSKIQVTEIAENKALLDNLEYGKVNKPLHFKLPPISLLNQPFEEKNEIDESEIDRKIEDLLAKLKMFRVEGDIVRTYSGPIVTTFEFRPAPHIKVSKILTLEDDLAMALRARSIRIQAPIPGKDVVGIEIPNNTMQTIYLREVLASDLFKTSTSPLTLALGKDIIGNPFITDLKKAPHLLIAGTTGSGKSVGINAMILSLLYKNSPDNLKLLMIDPKKVEFSIYADIPHLITPIITQPKKAIVGLNSAVAEMDRRYDLMSEMRAKDIDSYNNKVLNEGGKKFPYLVIIIDELADLMMTGGKEVEFSLARIAQMGRACGIHIIVATQRPSVDVVTGLIKTNLPSRISYKVGSKIDSKVILDTFGAESLLGKGDMLFTPPREGGVIRLHAPWNTEEEIEKVVEFIKSQQNVEYDKNFMLDEKENLMSENTENLNNENNDLLTEAKNIILQDKKTSASYLQRRLSIGYNKAANIVEQLEREGFLSTPNVKGVREILGDSSFKND